MRAKRSKDKKKPRKVRDLSVKGKRAAAVKGGVISGNKSTGVQLSGSNENPTESVSF